MSGLEMLTVSLAGELPVPPTRYLTGLRLIEASPGKATFALPASQWLCPPTGKVQGGVIAMLADAALATAITTVTPARTAMASIDLKVNFLRPGIADGRQVALATGSAILLPGRPASLSGLEVD